MVAGGDRRPRPPRTEPRMRPFRMSVLAALLLGAPIAAAPAQEISGSVTFNLLSVEGLVIGTTVTVDADFGAEHGLEVPAPFSFLVPTADDVRELMDPAPRPGDAFVKVNFATNDLALIENLQFVPITLPMTTPDERLQTLAQLLAEDAFSMAVAGYENYTRDLVRLTTVGDYQAVEVIGRIDSPDLGLIYVRLVGIPNPAGPESVFTIANVVAALEPLPSPEDFPQTRGGTALKHFKYLE
jgi:hypothetical protein